VKPPGAFATAARDYGVRVVSADHGEEVAKIAAEIPDPAATTVAVRIATPGTEAEMDLSGKFGAAPGEAARLMRLVAEHGMRPGIAFHVGSQCRSPAAYTRALDQVGSVISEAGVRPACVDIGGGFPAPYGSATPPLADFADAVRSALAGLDLPGDCRIMAEPGRAIVAQGMSLLVQVHLRAGRRLYINDGVFGSLGEVSIVGLRPPARVVRPTGKAPASATQVYEIAGPTCDSVDMIPEAFELPADIATGDWIEIDCMGAYSNALASRFNGFDPCTFVEVGDPPPCS
jgi:ornithine decarboxylase